MDKVHGALSVEKKLNRDFRSVPRLQTATCTSADTKAGGPTAREDELSRTYG